MRGILSDSPSDQKMSLTASLNNLIDLFKKITIKIRENNKSVVDQVNEIEREILKAIKIKSVNLKVILFSMNKNRKIMKYINKLEKEKID